MEDKEIIRLWQNQGKRLNESLEVNTKIVEEMMQMKSTLSAMNSIKIFAIIAGVVWVGPGSLVLADLFVHAYDRISHFFLFSAGIQVLITAVALVIYLYQLILINSVDISEPILATQQRLTRLKASTLLVTRILFLQLPLWTTFYWNGSIFKSDNILYLTINGIVTIAFTAIAIWLFFNIRYENKDKRWFKMIFGGKEWDPILQSVELSKNIEAFKNENQE